MPAALRPTLSWILATLLLVCALPRPVRAAEPPPFDPLTLPQAELVTQARADLTLTRRHADGLARILRDLQPHRALFDRPDGQPLTPEEKRLVQSAWGAFYDYVVAIETIRQRWWGFVAKPPTGAAHAWGLVVTHHALTAQLGFGGQFAALTTGKPALETMLDEPDDAFGVPAGSFAAFKLQVLHVGTTTQLLTGDAYLALVRPLLTRHGVGKASEARRALEAMPVWSRAARSTLLKTAGGLIVKNGADLLKDWSMRAVLPVQKAVAEWLGDTRVHRVGKPLISQGQVEALLASLRPGDVVVARQNWYLSNLGLPGFWPHAELYLGTPQELSAAFDQDPEVCAWVQGLPARQKTLTAHLAAVYPQPWRIYNAGKDFQGHGPIRVIESISEGVSFTASEHALLVDYLGVLRPRLSPVAKARAVVRAFAFQGRPYDFDFDFLSDRALVCTELVWKSYAPEAQGQPGLQIPLVQVVGRTTLPANEIVRLFDAEADRPDRQLDFVAFLDGQEASGQAVLGDAAGLRASWKRVKWDVAQK